MAGLKSAMDRDLFAANAPGQLIQLGDHDWAFLPSPLPPPTWSFPNELWPILADAKQLIGELEGVGSVVPNPGLFLRPLTDREAIRSSSLEGTYATPTQLLLYELEPSDAKSDSDPSNDYREVLNYRHAIEHGMASSLPLSLRLFRELHDILLRGTRGRDKTPGEFRKVQVAIGATRRFVPPPPEAVTQCLNPLEQYIHAARSTFDPIVDCFLVHYQFETIHPFVDGNGRVGRLVLAIMLQQRCRLSKPWLYMSEFFERHRDEYVQRLFAVSTKGDWSSWIEFCLVGVREQARDTIKRCRRLLAVRQHHVERVNGVGGATRLHQILDGVFHTPFVRIADLTQKLKVSYPTAKADVDRLVQAGVLQELPGLYPKTFFAPEVYNVAYDALDDIGVNKKS
jgi:Fic family protein